MPVPVSGAGELVTGAAVPPGALPVTVTDPVNGPVVTGRNLTRMVQLAPEAKVVPQFPVKPVTRENGTGLTLIPAAPIVNATGPALLSVKSWVGALATLIPLCTDPNAPEAGVSVTAGSGSVTVNETVLEVKAPRATPMLCAPIVAVAEMLSVAVMVVSLTTVKEPAATVTPVPEH